MSFLYIINIIIASGGVLVALIGWVVFAFTDDKEVQGLLIAIIGWLMIISAQL